jgi:aspartate/methionine/tyrosine aminotransferase
MYAFPKINFPEHILKKAKEQNVLPDLYYCLALIEKTGIVSVPGSGFEQKEGTWHIRLTNLICPKGELIKTLNRIEEFNNEFFSQ